MIKKLREPKKKSRKIELEEGDQDIEELLKNKDAEIRRKTMTKPFKMMTYSQLPERESESESEEFESLTNLVNNIDSQDEHFDEQTQCSIDSEDLFAIKEMDEKNYDKLIQFEDLGPDVSPIEIDEDYEEKPITQEKERLTTVNSIVKRFNDLKTVGYDRVFECTVQKPWRSLPFSGPSVVIAVDPGPRNCGIAIADLATMNVISIDKRDFRGRDLGFQKRGTDLSQTAISCNELIEKWLDYVYSVDQPQVIWLIEDQIAGVVKKSNNREQEAMVFSLKGATRDRCIFISPSAVESFYKDKFPGIERYDNESDTNFAQRKRTQKKKCGVKFAKELISGNFSLTREFVKDFQENHDIADAIIMIKFYRDKKRGVLSYAKHKKKYGSIISRDVFEIEDD